MRLSLYPGIKFLSLTCWIANRAAARSDPNSKLSSDSDKCCFISKNPPMLRTLDWFSIFSLTSYPVAALCRGAFPYPKVERFFREVFPVFGYKVLEARRSDPCSIQSDSDIFCRLFSWVPPPFSNDPIGKLHLKSGEDWLLRTVEPEHPSVDVECKEAKIATKVV